MISLLKDYLTIFKNIKIGHEWGGKQIGSKIIIVLRSGVVFSLGSWHTIRAGRYGRKLFLWVDGTVTTETLTSHHFFTSFNTSVYIGILFYYSVYEQSYYILTSSCIQNLYLI